MVLVFLRRTTHPVGYADHFHDIVKETMDTKNIEGYGEKDVAQYDISLLRGTPQGKLING